MASNHNVCAGCLNGITKAEFLKCCECMSKYDIACVNVPSNNFYLMDNDYKSTWICPECSCKQLKRDNTNTPLRSANNTFVSRQSADPNKPPSPKNVHLQHCPSDSMNVTLRKKSTEVFSEQKLRDIIKQELNIALKSTFNDFFTDHLNTIRNEIAEFKNSFVFFNEIFEEFKKKFEAKDNLISQLESDNKNLQLCVNELSSRLCVLEQNMRENNVEINGLQENKSENLVTTLQTLAKVTGVDITDTDIMHVTRVAKLNKETDRPRTVIAKLRSPRLRDSLLAAVASFNKKQPNDKLNSQHLGITGNKAPVFVSEHLSPTSKQLHAATRKLAKDMSFKFVWIRNGRIFVRKDINSKSIHIRNHDTLQLIKADNCAI